jgi:two-component system phosphate regulon response regulator PhoB
MEGGALTGFMEYGVVSSGSLAPVASEFRVMIIENGAQPERSLQPKLAQAGFKVSTVNHLENPCDAVDRERPHLVMVDWDLPDMIIMNLVRHVRNHALSAGPRLIALSSSASEQHIVSGFELGVDDYVVKPYSVVEVVARVRAVLRPSLRHKAENGYLQFHQLRMDTAQRRLTIREQTVGLRHMEFVLLEFLMGRPERAYSREVLLRQVWGADSPAGLRAVDMTIQRVRRALGLHGCGEYLQTVRGVGYRLSAAGGR